MATGTQKTEFDTDKFSFTKNSGGDEQTVGAYVVTKKDNLVLVHQTHALKHNEPAAENSQAVAFFRAPGVVQTLECAGDRIAVGCQNGEMLLLRARGWWNQILSVSAIAEKCVLGNALSSLPRYKP